MTDMVVRGRFVGKPHASCQHDESGVVSAMSSFSWRSIRLRHPIPLPGGGHCRKSPLHLTQCGTPVVVIR
jgi:hypothetical protein